MLSSSFFLRHVLSGSALVFLAVLGLPSARAAGTPAAPAVANAAPWVEPDFPFFSTVLDARQAGTGFPSDNLTPRGLVLNLGDDLWVCFDVDLLRVAAVWRGPGVSAKALAPGSYPNLTRKTQGGQKDLPQPEGRVWLANGIYPGAQTAAAPVLADPREPAPSPEEVGRGALPPDLGRFDAVRLVGDGVALEYSLGTTSIRERWTFAIVAGAPVVSRRFEVGASAQPLVFVLGRIAPEFALALAGPAPVGVVLSSEAGLGVVRLAARPTPARFTVNLGASPVSSAAVPLAADFPPVARWPETVLTVVTQSGSAVAYVVDHFALPAVNPWQRLVRPADIQFLPDGTGVVVTLDGDVWLARGLAAAPAAPVRWRRFASGLHEPMTAAIRDGEIYVFDKNGVWRLRDTDGNGEADVHELFSNAFAQTADMREFPSQIRLAPGGEFVIAKGGQQDATLGKHNGSVLRLSADGRRATVLGYGFRQPNIGVNVRTGLVTASDQQGQYIPSTPLHIVRDGQFYGFLAAFQPKEKYPAPIADPLAWLPHAVNAAAMSQVWLFGARMGPLDDSLVNIGFNRPELFRVLIDERGPRPQASVVSITQDFAFTPLNGSVNPADGQLYLAGFQVIGWGNVIDAPAGLGRVRYTGAPVTLPREVVATDRGVLLRFDVALDPAAARDPARYSLQTWGYRRTFKYGSPQYKSDGTPGQDSLIPAAAYLAADGRSVFIAVPGMKPVDQLRVGWSLATAAGAAFANNAYTTPYALPPFDPRAAGFGDLAIDLTPRAAVVATVAPATVDEGRKLAQLFACVACHEAEAASLAKSGPTWRKLYGSTHKVFVAGAATPVTVDDAYIRESILEPTAKIAAGFEKGEYAMPSYAGVLNDPQIESLVLYIKSLR